ncbi:hypothetical protein BH23CYA1_BH23CYA1_10570 [soil metagenome]
MWLITLNLPLALPWASLPDSLDTLGSLAAQLQSVITAAVSHPIRAIAAVVLTITLLQIIADLIKRALKAGLTFVLKLPLALSQWLWRRATMTPPTEEEVQISQLMARLDALRQEQDQVVAEIKSLLALPKAVSTDLATSDTIDASAEANAQAMPTVATAKSQADFN